MFKRKSKTQATVEQIPYSLYQTLQKDSPRRGKGLLEIVLAAVVVLLLVAGGVWLFREVHDAKTPTSSSGSNVTQSPQSTSGTGHTTGKPATTTESNTNNSAAVTPPSN